MAGQQYTEGQYLKGSDGNTYVVRGGVPMRADAAPTGGPQVIMPTSPVEAAKTGAEISHTQAETDSARVNAARTSAITPADIRKTNAEASKAEIEAQLAATAAASKPDAATSRIQQQLQTDDVLAQIARARELINGGYATGITGAVLGKVPGTNATDLDSTLNMIKGNITLGALTQMKSQSAQGASGMGALSDSEGRLLSNSVASLDQRQSKEQILDNLASVERHYRNSLAFLNKEDPRDPKVMAKYGVAADAPPAAGAGQQPPNTPRNGVPPILPGAGGGAPPSPPGAGGPSDPLALSKDGTTVVADPTRAGLNNHVRGMIMAGASAADIRTYLNGVSPGLGNSSGFIDDWVKFHSQHPRVAPSVNLETKTIPLTPVQQTINSAAQSPFGAFVMNAGDAATAGFLDNMTSNPALARAGMSAVSGQHPGPSFAGQLTGGALTSLAGEGLAARIGLKGMAALRGADAGYGALYGAGNADDGNRLGGALAGGTLGLGGGLFGRKLASVAGRTFAGVQDAGKRALIQSGVPLTIGQALGGAGKGLEDRMTGMPLIGDLINARRKEGMTEFQRQAFNEALSPINGSTGGAISENGIASGLRQVGDAYRSALGGVNVGIDPQYKAATGALAQKVAGIPRVGPELSASLDAIVTPMFENGQLSGESMQAVDRGLQQARSGWSNDPLFVSHIAPAVDAAGGNIRGLFERQAPDVLPGYDAAKGAYRNMSVLADTVNAGVNTGGEFTAAQLGQQARKNAIKFGGRNAAASGERPFALLQRAAQEVLPSKIPDSGTAGRLAVPAIAGGLGALGGYASSPEDARQGNATMGALTLGALAAMPYTKLSQKLISEALLAERPASAVAIGNTLTKNQRLLGMFGRSAALPYYGKPGY